MDVDEKLALDYEQTNELIRTLTDVRFKLLAFVPALTGAAVALVTRSQSQVTVLAVGLLGLFVTLGIVFYELRNTVIYDAAMHRAKWLEVSLGLPPLTKGTDRGGLFNERGGRPFLFYYRKQSNEEHQQVQEIQDTKDRGFLKVWHDRGLAMVYGSAIGGWVYVAANSLLRLLTEQPTRVSGMYAVLAAALVASLSFWTLGRFDKLRDQPQPREQTAVEE